MSLLRRLRPIYTEVFQLLAKSTNGSTPIKQIFQSPLTKRCTFITIASLAFIWPMKKAKPIQTDKSIENTTTILESADDLFEKGRYEDTYQLLSNFGEKGDVEVQWRIVRALYNMALESKYENSYKKDMVFLGYDIISKLIDTHQDHFAVQKWFAVMLYKKSDYEGIKSKIRELENVKKHMDLAVTLNPNDATVLFMLGEWCYQISGMSWHQRKIAEILFASPPTSTYEEALEYFLRAETAQPRFMSLNLLRIGNCYLKLQKEDQAKYYLKLAASYPAKSNDDLQANKEAAELLKRLR